MQHETSAYTVQSVHKAFEIMDILSDNPDGTNINDLASRIDMSRNKTFRLLANLCEIGLAELDQSSGNYRVGISSLSLAQKLVRHSNVICLAHPILEHLAKKHDEDVYMTIIRDDDVLFLDMANCDQQVKAMSLLGKSFPYFTNAAGKVMKALESTEVVEWLTSKKSLKNKNISNPESLASELLEIRSNGGVAIETGGLGDGIITVAVAVKDYAGQVIGAITMLGPSFRFLRDRLETEIIPSLVEGAALASKKFGYMPA